MRDPKGPSFWQRLTAKKLPKPHLITVGAVALFAIGLLAMLPSKEAAAKRQEVSIDLSFQESDGHVIAAENQIAITVDRLSNTKPVAAPDVSELTDSLNWKTQTVRSGDNLSTLFQRASLDAGDVYRLMSSTPLAKPLVDIRPGQEIQLGLNKAGELTQLKYIKSKLESYLYTNSEVGSGQKFTGQHILLEPEIMTAYRESVIKDSLFLAGDRAQLPHGMIMELANIFGWDIDFALDIRKGDRFSLLYEEKFLDGEKIGNGNILSAEFTNQGKPFRAVRYQNSKGLANYYTPEGYSMRKAFLRAPLDFARISSGFNLRRKHPIHKNIRAHRGVDYAAPRGTPIFSAGDGRVSATGYSKANGNYVFIQHGQRFTTKYLHLNKRKVKKGQLVKQRQVIGTVGSTGYATGPHLHYEFLVNGVHRNPRTVALPQAKPIPVQERVKFEQDTAPLMMQLASYQQSSMLALAN
ncbi:peptidase M23 [Gammaproteobacteria bacterium 54_18_T64]|nr:peptidase M23 [Gammaproteobacteria bacterium 54_18_T64]